MLKFKSWNQEVTNIDTATLYFVNTGNLTPTPCGICLYLEFLHLYFLDLCDLLRPGGLLLLVEYLVPGGHSPVVRAGQGRAVGPAAWQMEVLMLIMMVIMMTTVMKEGSVSILLAGCMFSQYPLLALALTQGLVCIFRPCSRWRRTRNRNIQLLRNSSIPIRQFLSTHRPGTVNPFVSTMLEHRPAYNNSSIPAIQRRLNNQYKYSPS